MAFWNVISYRRWRRCHGLLGSWFAANSADNMKEGLTGKAPTPARDGVAKMAPLVGMTAATGLAAGNLAASAPEAALSAWVRPGVVAGVTDAVTSFVPTGTPPANTVGGVLGAAVREGYDTMTSGSFWGLTKQKCTPDTQPRDMYGRFSHCGHNLK